MSAVVRVHCGSAHVSGRARNYAYLVASLYRPYTTRDGRQVYRYAGKDTSPRRSYRLACQDAAKLAEECGAVVLPGTGALHNRPVVPCG